MKSGVYKLYWDNTPYYYIGSSTNIDNRFEQHKNLLNSGVHNRLLMEQFNKNGFPKLEILESIEDKTQLPVRELYHYGLCDKKYSLNILMQKTPRAHSGDDFQKKIQCI